MQDALDTDRLQALGDNPAAQYARAVIARMQADLKFQQTRIAALSFELARLKQWRFGQSSEALDTQGQLFDAKSKTSASIRPRCAPLCARSAVNPCWVHCTPG